MGWRWHFTFTLFTYIYMSGVECYSMGEMGDIFYCCPSNRVIVSRPNVRRNFLMRKRIFQKSAFIALIYFVVICWFAFEIYCDLIWTNNAALGFPNTHFIFKTKDIPRAVRLKWLISMVFPVRCSTVTKTIKTKIGHNCSSWNDLVCRMNIGFGAHTTWPHHSHPLSMRFFVSARTRYQQNHLSHVCKNLYRRYAKFSSALFATIGFQRKYFSFRFEFEGERTIDRAIERAEKVHL